MPPPDFPADLAERIDRSFGDGPDPTVPVEVLLSRGRRLRGRRRAMAAGGAAAAVVVAAAGLTLALSGGADRARGTDGYVSSPSAATTASPTTTPSSGPGTTSAPVSEREREHLKTLAARAVTFGGDGHVSLAAGAAVVRSVTNPYGATAPAWSRGLAVEFHGHEFWYAESGPGDGSTSGATQYVVVQGGAAAFDRFVAQQDPGGARTTSVGPDVWPDVTSVEPVRLTAGGVLVAQAGFHVLSQREGVDVGRAWAGPGDETAAALVRAEDGSSYFVLARRFSGKPAQYVTVPQAGNGADLAGFLALATTRYAGATSSR